MPSPIRYLALGMNDIGLMRVDHITITADRDIGTYYDVQISILFSECIIHDFHITLNTQSILVELQNNVYDRKFTVEYY